MMRRLLFWSLLILCVPTVAARPPETIAVIVNSQNQQKISPLDIKNIYMDRVVAWDNGNKIAVYNLPVAAYGREVFSRQVLGMSAQSAAAAESNRNITNTNRNPQEIQRERLIPYLVASNPNAIAYAREQAVQGKENIRIIMILTPE